MTKYLEEIVTLTFEKEENDFLAYELSAAFLYSLLEPEEWSILDDIPKRIHYTGVAAVPVHLIRTEAEEEMLGINPFMRDCLEGLIRIPRDPDVSLITRERFSSGFGISLETIAPYLGWRYRSDSNSQERLEKNVEELARKNGVRFTARDGEKSPFVLSPRNQREELLLLYHTTKSQQLNTVYQISQTEEQKKDQEIAQALKLILKEKERKTVKGKKGEKEGEKEREALTIKQAKDLEKGLKKNEVYQTFNKLSFYASLADVKLEDSDYEALNDRPKTRAECLDTDRPCAYIGCRHNLMLDVDQFGNIHINYPDLESMPYSCVLDIIDESGNKTLEAVGQLYSCTRENIRIIEEKAIQRFEKNLLRITGLSITEIRSMINQRVGF